MKTLTKKHYKFYDLIGLAFKVAPMWATLHLILRLTAAFVPMLIVLTTANFIDTSIEFVTGDGNIQRIYFPAIALGIIIAYQWINEDLFKFVSSKMTIVTRLTYKVELIDKQAKLAYKHIENQETYDLIKRIVDPSETKIFVQYNQALSLLSLLIHTLSLLGIILINIWWASILILVFTIPAVYIAIRAGKNTYQAMKDMSKVERKANYLAEICSGRGASLERSLFGFGKKMTEQLWERFEEVRIHKQNRLKQEEINVAISGILLSSTMGVVMLALLYPVATGIITIGLFMSLVVAYIDLTSWLTNTMPWKIKEYTENLEYLKELTTFVNLEESSAALSTVSTENFNFETLEFKNVSFTYPGTEKFILKDVNFSMKSGIHYAFVGVNGAGKTTIIKLLTGQYNNYTGEIFINGKDLKTYEISTLKAIFGVVYQDFARYEMTLKDNILIGNLTKNTIDSQILKDLELDKMVASLANGLNTPLGKVDKNGVDLSGGQWQRVALARILMKNAPITILDEPTAALDPISESRLYGHFEKMMKNRTSIFISHRLGSTKLADEILVFENGTVFESGTHNKLMEQNGIYAKMYQSQQAWYEESEVAVYA